MGRTLPQPCDPGPPGDSPDHRAVLFAMAAVAIWPVRVADRVTSPPCYTRCMMDHDRQTSSGLAASVLRAAGVALPWEAEMDGLTVPADLHAAIQDESTVSRQFDVPDDWPFGGLT